METYSVTSRRAFLALAAGLPLSARPKVPDPLGLQLYSLRRQAQKDLEGTLALVRQLGFEELEAGGFYGRTVTEFQRMLRTNRLKVTSLIAGWDQLLKSTSEVAEQAGILGAKYVSCTSIPRQRRVRLTV